MKKKVTNESTMIEELDAMLDEQFQNNKLLLEENEILKKTLNSNNRIAFLLANQEQLRTEINVLKSLNANLSKRLSEAINHYKACKKRYKELEKTLKV